MALNILPAWSTNPTGHLWDGDPEKHIISYKSPLGQALLSKKPGDHVKVKSGGAEHDYAVTGISAFVNAPPAATT